MRSKIKQFLIYVLQVLIFALLSAAHIFLTIKSGKYDLMSVYLVSATFFLFWLLGIIFKLKLLRFMYKFARCYPNTDVPPSADTMNARKSRYEDAARRFPGFVQGLLKFSYITLVIGIVVALSICLYTHAF